MHSRIFYVLVIFAFANGVQLPDYMHQCSVTDPNVNECLVESANFAIPHIIDGVKSLRIPSVKPLLIDEINAEQGPNFKITLRNTKAYGLETSKIISVDANFEKRIWKMVMYVEKYTILADYEINGRILFLPIHGSGPCNFTIDGATFTYTMGYQLKPKRKGGPEHIRITTDNTEISVKRSYNRFDNLFNGDKRLGEEMNRFLDENWKEFFVEMKPTVQSTVSTVITSFLNNVYSTIPYKDVFLP